jgi:glycosyltransferase involved in cell wall biosynthesis
VGTKIGVLHLVDSLAFGGTEHMAVQLANNLPQDTYSAYLCSSRQGGPLRDHIKPHVTFLELHRQSTLDVFALIHLARFIKRENIRIIHAHTSSLFIGVLLCWLNPHLCLVWHDHAGYQSMQSRSIPIYKFLVSKAQAIFTVTKHLEKWAVDTLGIPNERVKYLHNFVESDVSPLVDLGLPGQKGKRIVCVANIRSQKDHLSLVNAMVIVACIDPPAHLLLVGEATDSAVAEKLQNEVHQYGLEKSITWLGQRNDVPQILANCDIGVLSSVSEGFPVALLEYGLAGLGVAATNVGECAEILNDGQAGIIVPPSNPKKMAEALLRLLESASLREGYGERLKQRVIQKYTADVIEKQICQVYERILE